MLSNPNPNSKAMSASQTGPKTRSRETMHTHAELIDDPNTAINNHQQARTFFDKYNYASKEDALSAEGLSFILLSLSHSILLKILQEGTRVDSNDGQIEKIYGRRSDMVCRKTTFYRMDELAEEQKENTEATKRAAEEVSGIKTREEENGRNGMTYAVAFRGNVPLSHPKNLAKARARKCQILIDKEPNTENNTLNDLTEQELVAKSNEAITQMDIAEYERDIIFLGTKKLNNGGIVLDHEKPEMACWLQQNKNTFLEKFSATATLKYCTIFVIIEYVLIIHSPDALAEYPRIERNSKLPVGSFISTR